MAERARATQAVPAAPTGEDRRSDLLRAGLQIFGRYGFRKASMDEVARAADLSRQGLYLHFPTKEALFRGVVEFLLDGSLGAGEAALGDGSLPSIEERLLTAFDLAHGQFLGTFSSAHMEELLEASQRLLGDLVRERERAFTSAVTTAVRRAGLPAAPTAATARAVAETLDSASYGFKHRSATRDEYRARMRDAIRVCCGLRAR